MNNPFVNSQNLFLSTSLPHNFLAEKNLLSCLLKENKFISLTIQSLKVDAFYFRNHQQIYKALLDLYSKTESIDMVMLTNFLQNTGQLASIGGIDTLIELGEDVPNVIYVKQYIELINDKFLRRLIIQLCYQTSNSAYITNYPTKELLLNLESQFQTMITTTTNHEINSTAQLSFRLFSELRKKYLDPALPGIASGFSELDAITQGFQRSDLIILAGRPSMGKTALGLNIALNSVKITKKPVLIFTLEMSKEQIMYRLLAIESLIDQTKLKAGDFFKEDWLRLTKIVKILSRLPLFINDTPNLSLQDLQAVVRKTYFEQKKLSLIIIDYLQLIKNSSGQEKNRVSELSEITKELKSLAREYNVPILVLSQLSRRVEARVDKRPILSDLRESGSIEQDADLVLMIFHDKSLTLPLQPNDLNTIELIVAKHRNGAIGTIPLIFKPNQMKFRSLGENIKAYENAQN